MTKSGITTSEDSSGEIRPPAAGDLYLVRYPARLFQGGKKDKKLSSLVVSVDEEQDGKPVIRVAPILRITFPYPTIAPDDFEKIRASLVLDRTLAAHRLIRRIGALDPWSRESILGTAIKESALRLPVRTDRLELRRFVQEDWSEVHRYQSDPEVVRYLHRGVPVTRAESFTDVKSRIAFHPQGNLVLAVIRQRDGKLIGEGILGRSAHFCDHFLGFVLRRDAWGNGYGTEVAQAMLRLAFERLQVPRVLAGCHPENHASRRILEGLRMTPVPSSPDFPGSPKGVASLAFEIDRARFFER